MEFTKMHGCGNDYIYFDCTRQPMDRDLASQLAVAAFRPALWHRRRRHHSH